MVKDPGKPSAYLGIITSILGILLVIIGKITLLTLTILITLAIAAITFTFLSYYINQTKKNEEEIRKIKDNLIIDKRLNRLEIKVFENE